MIIYTHVLTNYFKSDELCHIMKTTIYCIINLEINLIVMQ